MEKHFQEIHDLAFRFRKDSKMPIDIKTSLLAIEVECLKILVMVKESEAESITFILQKSAVEGT